MADRKVGHAPRVEGIAKEVSCMVGPCVGCTECQGLCTALIEAMTVPDIILNSKKA